MLVKRISRAFGRLTRPKINQHKDVFHLMRDNQTEIALIQKANQARFNIDKNYTIQDELERELGISKEISATAAHLTLDATAYSLSMKPYNLKQKLSGKLQVDEVLDEQMEGRYRPGGANLKFHYSINQDLPVIPEYEPNSTRAYIFKLPEGITEKEIMIELGHRFVESVKIEYSMLGVPAYAVIEFNSDTYLTDRAMQQEVDVYLNDQSYTLSTEIDSNKLQLSSRQLVLHGMQAGETPATMLRFLSQFGHVMHLDLPMEIYREQSVEEIKKLYEKETEPVRINFHKKDGTIESEYYPPMDAPKDSDFYYKKNQEYQRRLRYCENIDIYEGKEDQITVRPKGFCTVTFSCQEEAQSCYFFLRNTMKVELKNGREDFEFDTKHREALLRHIDNQYIEHCKKNNPTSQIDNYNKKLNSLIFQSFYLNMIYEENKNIMYNNAPVFVGTQTDDRTSYFSYYEYKRTIQKFKESIGKDSFQDDLVGNKFGKSFDELAEQELYGAKLSKNKYQRYEVNIDDYIRTDPEQIMNQKHINTMKKNMNNLNKPQKEIHSDSALNDEESEEEEFEFKDYEEDEELLREDFGEEEYEEVQTKKKRDHSEDDGKFIGGRFFSTFRQTAKTTPKTLEQKVRSHLKYNQFVRNTLNEYMGVFSAQKLEKQFGRVKPTFANPQNLRFLDGSDFLPESDVKKALESSPISCQQAYDKFVKTNETVKSLNLDVEELMLKDLENNHSNILQDYTDVGRICEEFQFQGQNIEQVVEEMNRVEADIGEEYKAIINEETGEQKIAKIAKLENIVPLESIEKSKKHFEQIQKQQELNYDGMEEWFEHVISGKPLSEEMAKHFNMEAGTVVDVESIISELSGEIGVPIKDFEKMMNLSNYSHEQLNNDMAQQMQISKVRRRKAAKKAVDYSRDPADIRTKGEDGKFVPSKFRQM